MKPEDLKPGDVVRIRWDPANEKLARFVRFTRTGSVVVQVATTFPGRPWGVDRTFEASCLLGKADA